MHLYLQVWNVLDSLSIKWVVNNEGTSAVHSIQWSGSHRLEKYLNLEGFLEKSLKIKSALESTGKSLKGLEKSLNSSIFCRTKYCR